MGISPADIKRLAQEAGFDACGIASAQPVDDEIVRLKGWCADGYAAKMDYMERNLDLRSDPKNLLPTAESMIMVLLNYYPARFADGGGPYIAAYAYGNDYHHIVKQKLHTLAQTIKAESGGDFDYLAFCDSAPVLERAWAARAGLGWIGKNNMLINPTLGTFTFIGTLITSLPLEPDAAMPSRCGSCSACLKNCPTGALAKPFCLDANKCLSYLTIECRGSTPEFPSARANNVLFGCDDCQLACPWNRFAHPHRTEELKPLDCLFSTDWSTLTRSVFKHELRFSPMNRAGYKKIRDRAIWILNKRREGSI